MYSNRSADYPLFFCFVFVFLFMQKGTGVSRRFKKYHSSELLTARRELNPQDGEKALCETLIVIFNFVISCFLIHVVVDAEVSCGFRL